MIISPTFKLDDADYTLNADDEVWFIYNTSEYEVAFMTMEGKHIQHDEKLCFSKLVHEMHVREAICLLTGLSLQYVRGESSRRDGDKIVYQLRKP